MAAYVLTKAGTKCLMLEAGSWFDTAKDSKMLTWPYEAPHRGEPTPDKPAGYFDPGYGSSNLRGEPYTNALNSDGRWFQSRMLGGKTNHWSERHLTGGREPRSRGPQREKILEERLRQS